MLRTLLIAVAYGLSQFVSRLNLADSLEFLLHHNVPERGGMTLGERLVHMCE